MGRRAQPTGSPASCGDNLTLLSYSVICDLFIDNKTTHKKYAFELKAPLPNSDQTKVSKGKMFKLLAMKPPQVDYAYYALPYNPYGKTENYSNMTRFALACVP
ncbi:hypothetical protein GlitD10_1095 [Gloeomargarita lithophora Alchichica-D10]|uniref:type II site-specific deoxyribonuclease n=1 Tax=Gloeomargarita lithophora Alchichica-D10 TaxID=1188229 RepID=A0A1J0ABX1_9CYAN|nr:TdeIII family type II restriction endonuclease [Gloeomargarita lithophora]APB33415.1 hypothetical protein GlitD10_1095 [Gloeomargarita lithophora Alchichica-D10]